MINMGDKTASYDSKIPSFEKKTKTTDDNVNNNLKKIDIYVDFSASLAGFFKNDGKPDQNLDNVGPSKNSGKSRSSQKLGEDKNENKHLLKKLIDLGYDKQLDIQNLHLLTDDLAEEGLNQPNSNSRLEKLVNLMMDDKSLIVDKAFSKTTSEMMLLQLFTCLSRESKKLVDESDIKKKREIQAFFHRLTSFGYDPKVFNNDTLTNLNHNMINIEDLYNMKEPIVEEEDFSDPHTAKSLIDMNRSNENKLIFLDEKNNQCKYEKMSKAMIAKPIAFMLESGRSELERVDMEGLRLKALNDLIELMMAEEKELPANMEDMGIDELLEAIRELKLQRKNEESQLNSIKEESQLHENLASIKEESHSEGKIKDISKDGDSRAHHLPRNRSELSSMSKENSISEYK